VKDLLVVVGRDLSSVRHGLVPMPWPVRLPRSVVVACGPRTRIPGQVVCGPMGKN
jgi:hypothetical protein